MAQWHRVEIVRLVPAVCSTGVVLPRVAEAYQLALSAANPVSSVAEEGHEDEQGAGEGLFPARLPAAAGRPPQPRPAKPAPHAAVTTVSPP